MHAGMEQQSPLQQAIKAAGSQEALAKQIGASQQQVSYWLKSPNGVSGPFVLAIEAHTGVSRHVLRPDIYGPAPAEGQAA